MIEEKLVRKGMYFRKIKEYTPEPVEGGKAEKQQKKDELRMVVDGIPFDGDTVSINYMSATLAVANYKMIEQIANGTSAADAYTNVFENMQLNWKGYDNQVHAVTGKTLAKALETAMGQVANIVGA